MPEYQYHFSGIIPSTHKLSHNGSRQKLKVRMHSYSILVMAAAASVQLTHVGAKGQPRARSRAALDERGRRRRLHPGLWGARVPRRRDADA